MRQLLGDLADLALGHRCLGCGTAGPGLCPACCARLASSPRRGSVAGLPSVAATPYEGAARDAVLAFKERGYRALAGPLGQLLAVAARSLVPAGPIVLVPVPAHRGRPPGPGHSLVLARRAAAALGPSRRDATVEQALVVASDYPALKGLGRRQRAAAVQGALAAGPVVRTGAVVVVDDVLTTGATLAEAVRALRQAGIAVAGTATVAATAPSGRG